jgi:hypothetical protein
MTTSTFARGFALFAGRVCATIAPELVPAVFWMAKPRLEAIGLGDMKLAKIQLAKIRPSCAVVQPVGVPDWCSTRCSPMRSGQLSFHGIFVH